MLLAGAALSHGIAHGTADKLVFCHEAMHVQLRMQDAGWSADVERWESDEDSDESEAKRVSMTQRQG